MRCVLARRKKFLIRLRLIPPAVELELAEEEDLDGNRVDDDDELSNSTLRVRITMLFELESRLFRVVMREARTDLGR